MVKLGNPKNAFWEAILLTVVIFVLGIFLGIALESGRVNKINEYYTESEIFLMDIFALNNLMEFENISCDELISHNINFADRIYKEAALLEKYEDAGKISDNIKLAHKKYDIARTLLWINSIKIMEKCEDFHLLIYLYEYETEDLVQKAKQKTWSKILFDFKQEKGNEVILIPIAADSNLTSLNLLLEKFNISEFPVLIINNRDVVKELGNIEEINKFYD